jgi:hypothetical protein
MEVGQGQNWGCSAKGDGGGEIEKDVDGNGCSPIEVDLLTWH